MALIDYATLTIQGPGKVMIGATQIFTVGDIRVTVDPELQPFLDTYYGLRGKIFVNAKATIEFTPMPFWDPIATLIPAFYLTGVIGTKLVSADQVVDVWGANGDQWEFNNCHVTKPPQLLFGADVGCYGPMTMTAICDKDKTPDEADAWFDTIGTSVADPGSAILASNPVHYRWTGNYKTAAGVDHAGFATFEPRDHFTVDFTPEMREEKYQGLTRNWSLVQPKITVRCKPVGPTQAQIDTARGIQGVKQGALIQSVAGQLKLSSEVDSHSLTLLNMHLASSGALFGGSDQRNQEIVFENVASVSTVTLAQLAAFA